MTAATAPNTDALVAHLVRRGLIVSTDDVRVPPGMAAGA
jgi:hypothetical protein